MKRNTLNDLRQEIKFENRVNDKNNFLLSETFLFFLAKIFILNSWKCFFFLKTPKNLIASEIFLPRQILKIIDIPWQKPRHLPITEANFEHWSRHFYFHFLIIRGKKLY